jgi:hypothetical protein
MTDSGEKPWPQPCRCATLSENSSDRTTIGCHRGLKTISPTMARILQRDARARLYQQTTFFSQRMMRHSLLRQKTLLVRNYQSFPR